MVVTAEDRVLVDDWHPVAAALDLAPGKLIPVRLLDREIVLWRADGTVRAWEDRCPHRGTRLSIGSIQGQEVVCGYHGWHFDCEGRCAMIPAHPGLAARTPARVKTFRAGERYGLIWVSVGEPARDVAPFPEYDDAHLRKIVCGPYEVAASGPRIVENFLDMAHFPFVHEGILGDVNRTEVRDCEIVPFDDGQGGQGVQAVHCFFWQPQTNTLAQGGSEVEYAYRVVRPLTAILNKVPEAQVGFREAISLHVQPLEEERSRVWMILALTSCEQTEAALRAFQDRIFLQDRPILENQVPRKLPLDPGAEQPVRCDRLSLAYRRYLRELGLRYGVERAEPNTD
jgi:phenylpropionate dioxygenase-like ring-hydroxylating dioxygenase large terminal subunit